MHKHSLTLQAELIHMYPDLCVITHTEDCDMKDVCVCIYAASYRMPDRLEHAARPSARAHSGRKNEA
eukprot:7890323-Karenia_brevis.AAC.1